MAYDYAIQVDGTTIDGITGVDWSRFIKWTGGSLRGSNPIIGYRDGEYSDFDKWWSGADVLLEVGLKATADATAAQALSDIQELFGSFGAKTVQYADPALGNLRALTELLTEPTATQNRFVYLFPLRNPKGVWEDVSASNAASANPPVVTTLGDRPIDDMVLTAAGPGFLEHTDSQGRTSRVTIDAGAGAGIYIVDCGARTVKKAGADQDAFLTVDQPWWMRFEPNLAQSFTSDVAWEVDWRNKWA